MIEVKKGRESSVNPVRFFKVQRAARMSWWSLVTVMD